MNERNQFLIALGSTMALGLFGVVGALYLELLKDVRSSYAILFDVLGILFLGYITMHCFLTVNSRIEEEESNEN